MFTPTPFVTVEIENEFKENGKIKKSTKVTTIKGKVLSYEKDGTGKITDLAQSSENSRLAILQQKYAQIESSVTQKTGDVFATVSGVSVPHLSGQVKLRSKSFQVDASNMFADYTIVLEQVLNQPEDVDETWSLEPADEYNRFVKISRIRSITLESTENATYQLAMSKISANSSVADGAALLPSPIAVSVGNSYNKTTSYNVNTEKNSVECNESWTICTDSALVDDNYSVKESTDSVYKTASRQISIKGLEGASSNKYANALKKYDALKKNWQVGRKETIAGITGNIKSISVGKNELAGTVTVNIDISEGIELDGEISKTIDITDNPPTDHYASIAAVGKAEGPILQKFGTKKQGTRSVTLNVIYVGGNYKVPDIGNYAPASGQVYVDKDEIFYDERSGRITRSVSWVYGGDQA